LFQICERDPLLYTEYFDSHNLIVLVEIEHDTGLDLFGLDYRRGGQSQINSIGCFVKMNLYGRFLWVRSK